MLNIQSNTINIPGRVIMSLILSIGEYLIIKNGILDGQESRKGIVLLSLMVGAFTLAFILPVRSFFQIMKVRIEESSEEIFFTRLFSTKKIKKVDITGYYTTVYKGSREKPWLGLVVVTKDNRSFRLTEQNLKSIDPLEKYFEKENLPNLDEKRRFWFL